MDEVLQRQQDAIVEDEIRRGWRIKTLPTHILESLAEARDQGIDLPEIQRIRLVKLTAKKKRLINDHVVLRYHQDLKNPALLSSSQLRKLNIERGEWSEDRDIRITELQKESQNLIRSLYSKNVNDREQWIIEQLEAEDRFRELVKQGKDHDSIDVLLREDLQDTVLGMFDRWARFDSDMQEAYDGDFAEEQGLENYSASTDFTKLMTLVKSTEALEAMSIVSDMKENVAEYIKCLRLRNDLMELQMERAKIMQDSVEQRRDQTQEMAQMYYCCEIVDQAGQTVGPLTENYDDIWDLPDDIVQWLLVELYLFFDGTTDSDETREFLQQWGFIQAPPKVPMPDSDGSQEEQTSSSDLEPSAMTGADSSE